MAHVDLVTVEALEQAISDALDDFEGGSGITFAKVSDSLPWGNGGGFFSNNSTEPEDGPWYSFGEQSSGFIKGPDFVLAERSGNSYIEMGYRYQNPDDDHAQYGYFDFWMAPGGFGDHGVEFYTILATDYDGGGISVNHPLGTGGLYSGVTTFWSSFDGTGVSTGAAIGTTDEGTGLFLKRRSGQTCDPIAIVRETSGALFNINADGSFWVTPDPNGTVFFATSGTGNVTFNADDNLMLEVNSTGLGFYGVTPVARAGAITAPSGGGTVDTQARAAIASLITAIKNIGITS